MPWEKRSSSKRSYYTRSRRSNGRTIREYVGPQSDPGVRLIADWEALRRAEIKAATAAMRAEQDQFKELEPALETLAKLVDEAQEIHLLVCGYRRRNGALEAMNTRAYESSRRDTNGDETVTRELFEHLVHRANYGDATAAQELREILQDNPEIWQNVGDLARQAREGLVELIAEGNTAIKESVTLKLQEIDQSLRREATDETLESLLIDHIVVCWLELYFVRMAAMQRLEHKKDQRFWDGRVKQANRRYVSAIKELGNLRSLLGRPASVLPFPGVDSDATPTSNDSQGAN